MNGLSGVAFFLVSHSSSSSNTSSRGSSSNLFAGSKGLGFLGLCLLWCWLGRGAEAAASGLCSAFGLPEEGGPQRSNGGLYSSSSNNGNSSSMKPVTRTSGGGTYERPRTESLLDGGEGPFKCLSFAVSSPCSFALCSAFSSLSAPSTALAGSLVTLA